MGIEIAVKYQNALNSNDEVVNVNNLSRCDEIRKEIYRCISCEKHLRPVLGEIRKKHFRHVVEGICNPETYLHQLAKRIFFQIYSGCLETDTSFYVELYEKWLCTCCYDEFGIKCELDPKLIKFDLTKLFPIISIEKPEGYFIPDVLLSNEKGEKLFIEFVVTHISTEDKRNSGARIIELKLEDEADLEPIYRKLVSQTNFKIKFFNFKNINKFTCRCPSCSRKLIFFMLKTDGGAFILEDTPQNYKIRLERGDIVFSKFLSYGGYRAYFNEMEAAFHNKKSIKSCFLCRYHGVNIYRDEGDGPIFCKFLKHKFDSTRAVNCEFYRADPKAFPSQNMERLWY